MYCNKENVNILTALLVKYGVEDVVVCPGSRNAPLVHNFNECPEITCHPVTDERSAGFIALGISQQEHYSPVAVCVTSGTALLNLLPAVAEATYQQCGIIVISADRPAAWIDQLDGQTLPQPGALGRFVAKSVSLPEPHNDTERWHCNRLINEAFLEYQRPHHPSVHINVPISEPLFEFTTQELPLPDERLIQRLPWSLPFAREYVAERLMDAKGPMFIIGQTNETYLSAENLSELSQRYVILSEPISCGSLPQSFTDQMLYTIEGNATEYHPDLVIFIGGHTISKRLRHFMRSLDKDVLQIVVSQDFELRDISQNTQLVIQGDADDVINDINGLTEKPGRPSAFYCKWKRLREDIAAKHNAYLPFYSQMLAVKLFEEAYKEKDRNGKVYYANSMSIRLAALYAKHYCYCNRGVNGIEGSLSVAAGASLASMGNVYCVIGDLSFFYDENALWQQQLMGNFRILLLNNRQGGIFRNLKGLEKSAARDSLVSASHSTSAEGICHQFGIDYTKAIGPASLNEGIAWLTKPLSDRPMLLEVMTDPTVDEQEYKAYYKCLRL